MTIKGVDYSAGELPTTLLRDEGVQFTCRYVSHPGNPKNLTLGEAQAHAMAGIKNVTIFETTAGRALLGRDAGLQDGLSAQAQAIDLIQQPGAPIYFAVDFDIKPSQRILLDAYFNGVNAALKDYPSGIYGGYNAVSWAYAGNLCNWFFQTYAWSAGRWFDRAQLRQVKNGVIWGKWLVDLCEAPHGDYGGWLPTNAGYPSEPIVAPPTPKPADWMTTIMDRLPTLQQGMKDPVSGQYFVRRLQAFLHDVVGAAVGAVGVDGDFGPVTLGAVKSFQQTRHLTVDGIVGPKTWSYVITGTAL